MTPDEVTAAYNSTTVTKLRELLGDIYTPEEFGMYLASPNHVLHGGKSVLDLIHEGRAGDAIRAAQQLADCAYI